MKLRAYRRKVSLCNACYVMRCIQDCISTALILLKATISPDKVVQTSDYPSELILYHYHKKYPEYYDLPNQKQWKQVPT